MTPHPFAILQRRHERPLPRPPPIRHHQPSRHLLILIVALFSSCLSRYTCSSVGVIGRSATPGACSRSPSLPPEAPALGRHYPASTVVRASPPPWPARPCPHGSSVGACHATGRASRVASIPLFHTCRRQYPGGTGRCSRRSLPDRWQPSPIFGRVGFRVARFEACSAFTRVAARVLAEPPKAALCRRSASADVVTSIVRSDCYRLERQLPGGIRTRWGMAPFTAHRIMQAKDVWQGRTGQAGWKNVRLRGPWDLGLRCGEGARRRVSYPVSDSISCRRRANEHGTAPSSRTGQKNLRGSLLTGHRAARSSTSSAHWFRLLPDSSAASAAWRCTSGLTRNIIRPE